MLPADILYKMAQEGKYIDPDSARETYTDERESAPSSSTDDSKKSENLFGDFNFNIQGGGNPFLTTTVETPTEETTTPTTTTTTATTTTTTTEKPVEETTTQQPETPVQPFEIVSSAPDGQDHKNHHKPYFYYAKEKQGDSMGKWVLVVPPTENNEPPKISVAELVELSRSLVKASQRSGMNSNVTELPPQLFQEPQSVKEEKEEKPIKSNLPTASFVQEAESQTEEKTVTQLTPDEITIDGKLYKLVRGQKSQNPKHKHRSESLPTTTSIPVVLKTAAPEDIKPPEPILSDIYRHLTSEEEKILLELQRRIIQQQKEEVAKMFAQQSTVSSVPTFVLNGDSIQAPQQPSAPSISSFVLNREPINVPQQPKASSTPTLILNGGPINVPQQQQQPQQSIFNNYFGKVDPSANVPRIPTAPIPPKIQIQSINTPVPQLPMRKQYSLKELEEYYEAQKATQNVIQTTPEPEVKAPEVELTTPEKVFGPHRQVKIQMNVCFSELVR